MALITDPDDLADEATDTSSSEVFINTTTKRIYLRVYDVLTTDGVTEKCVYSFLKEEWTGDPHSKNLPAYPFPMVPITDAFYELVDGWDWGDATTRQLIRRGGWNVRDTGGTLQDTYANIQSLGTVGGSDQLYYTQVAGFAPTISNLVYTGSADEAVWVYDNGVFDYTGYFKLFNRIQGNVYSAASLADLSNVAMDEPVAYGFAVGASVDPKITVTDGDIDTLTPYTGMSITSYATAQARTVAGVSRDFGWIIDGNSGTAEQIYNWMQRQLRKATDIDADATGAVTGQVMDPPLDFVTSILTTQAVGNSQAGGTGVYIDNALAADVNRIAFTDNTGTIRYEDFQAVLTLNFNPNLVSDASAEYWVYFTTLPGRATASFSDAAITSASTTLTSATATFTAADVGLTVLVAGAGAAGADLVTTIASYTNGTTVELTASAGTTVSGANLDIYGDDWGEGSAIIVDDAAVADMVGTIGAASVQRTFDYTNNTQGGRTADTDAPFTAVAIGHDTAQYVVATGTIEKNTTNSVSLVGPLERNYDNPV